MSRVSTSPARTSLASSLAGHYWTVVPRFQSLPPDPPAEAWSMTVQDPDKGPVRLTGKWHEVEGATAVLILLHGIAGCADAHYARLGAAAARAQGLSCLRFNARGADGLGEDYYHAGLTGDILAAMDSPELAGYRTVYVLGYSLGGHLALRLAAVHAPERLAAVASVCSPLDLAACQDAFDRPAAAVYRLFVLRGLKRLYGAVAERRDVPCPAPVVRRIRTIREWDDRVVAPRWGFADAADYYARVSVGPHLSNLSVPTLMVLAENDPMIPASTLRPALEAADTDKLDVRWLRGAGHLGFPEGKSLTGPGTNQPDAGWSADLEAGLDHQIVQWLRRHGGD